VTVGDFHGVGGSVPKADLAVINGRPAVCYANGRFVFSLYYKQATDRHGNDWGAQVLVNDEAGDCSLTTIEGKPAIAYISGGDLKLVRALGADGVAWGEPILIDRAVNGSFSLATVNGKPAVAYTRYLYTSPDTYELRYAQATSADGATWSTPLLLDALRDGSWTTPRIGGPKLVLVNGVPAVGYYRNVEGSGGDVRYMRAKDADGATWGPYVPVAATAGVVSTLDFVVAGAYPAAAFVADRTLYYVQSADSVGGSWGLAEALDTPVKAQGELSMNIVAGVHAISYPGSLRYVSQRSEPPSAFLYLPFYRK
jgi:hypothetical protein